MLTFPNLTQNTPGANVNVISYVRIGHPPPPDGAKEKVKGLPNSVGFIVWGP